MIILMRVILAVPSPNGHHEGSHEPSGMTTQSHGRDAAKSDSRVPSLVIPSPSLRADPP